MLGRVGVGKGLNVKGKSSKKNRLSGFVPFLQISNNDHKKLIEPSPSGARTVMYYRSPDARQAALAELNKVLMEAGHNLVIDDPQVKVLCEYDDTHAFGLDMPEPLMRETYIMRRDISPVIGWETGRGSEPAFMNANLQAVRGNSTPSIVLYQFDLADALNPLGLLVAYAEYFVKPVVSDFDTFTVGSRGMTYESTPADQIEIIHWALDRTVELLQTPSTKGWMSRWLEVIKRADEEGFHPMPPKFGFGDPTSCAIIEDVVDVTAGCGAVRHGAECFNFWFPQELDDEFLVIWDGFNDPPWQSFSEPDLRNFLLDRIKEGYSFPINPVWPVRDHGWYEVLEALTSDEGGRANLKSWFPPGSGVLPKIEEMHKRFAKGFTQIGGETTDLGKLFSDRLQRKIDAMEELARKAGACDTDIERVRNMKQRGGEKVTFSEYG